VLSICCWREEGASIWRVAIKFVSSLSPGLQSPSHLWIEREDSRGDAVQRTGGACMFGRPGGVQESGSASGSPLNLSFFEQKSFATEPLAASASRSEETPLTPPPVPSPNHAPPNGDGLVSVIPSSSFSFSDDCSAVAGPRGLISKGPALYEWPRVEIRAGGILFLPLLPSPSFGVMIDDRSRGTWRWPD
jgi:hypothetical protein